MTGHETSPIRWPRVGAALAGAAWYLWLGGGPTLNPANHRWLMAGDWLQHWLGWLFFLDEPWGLPLGRVRSLLYPVGTNIAFTDSIPLLSLLLKPFAGFFPPQAQFMGPWLAACFVLQGYVGAALVSTVTRRSWAQWLGGVLFVTTPVLVARVGHEALCAHWLLLALLFLGLRAVEPDTGRTSSRWAAGLAVLSATIHPYLAAMCWVLAHAVFLRLWWGRTVKFTEVALTAAATTAAMLVVFGLVGYFGGPQLSGTGYGVFSADLLTFVNPMAHSRFLPELGRQPAQWEGLGYLGLGGLILFVAAVSSLLRTRPRIPSWTWPVVAACAVMALYALSNVVTFEGREVFHVRRLATDSLPFRASGRFIWPLHYLLLLFGVWGACRVLRDRRGWLPTAFLASAVAVQAADVRLDPWWFQPKTFHQVRLFNFGHAIGHYDHVALYPTQVAELIGAVAFEEEHAYRYMLLAHQLGMTYNSGHFARVPGKQVADATDSMAAAVRDGNLDRQTIYVVWEPLVRLFRERGAVCAPLDGDWVCVSANGHPAFRDYLTFNGGPVADGR
jgi:hypothetical protein